MMKNLLIGLLIFFNINSITQAQHLCLSYDIDIQKDKAQISVYIQADTTIGTPLASYSTMLNFSADKAIFDKIDYNQQLWDATFADQNPKIQYGKGKKNAYLQVAAVNMRPSSETLILKPVLLYDIQFSAIEAAKLKKGDFSLFFIDQATVESNYADYEGNSFAIRTCDYSSQEKLKEKEKDFIIAPNPACGEVSIYLNSPSTNKIQCIIYNLQAQPVQENVVTENTKQFTLDISNLKSGVYFLSLQDNGKSRTSKLIISECEINNKGKEKTSNSSQDSKL